MDGHPGSTRARTESGVQADSSPRPLRPGVSPSPRDSVPSLGRLTGGHLSPLVDRSGGAALGELAAEHRRPSGMQLLAHQGLRVARAFQARRYRGVRARYKGARCRQQTRRPSFLGGGRYKNPSDRDVPPVLRCVRCHTYRSEHDEEQTMEDRPFTVELVDKSAGDWPARRSSSPTGPARWRPTSSRTPACGWTTRTPDRHRRDS